MPNVQDLFHHGVIQQLRRVLGKMNDEQIDRGLDAFETGGKNWGHCFFARALLPERLHGEYDVQRILGLESPVPVRIIYTMFDEMENSTLDRPTLYRVLSDIRDERRPDEIMALVKSMNWVGAEERTLPQESFCA